jgi:hypothetical protein
MNMRFLLDDPEEERAMEAAAGRAIAAERTVNTSGNE